MGQNKVQRSAFGGVASFPFKGQGYFLGVVKEVKAIFVVVGEAQAVPP